MQICSEHCRHVSSQAAHFAPRIALCRAAENWQTQSSSAEAAGRGFSSSLKHRCLLLKSALEEEANLSMTLLFLIKMLLEMSPWRHCLVVLPRIVKDWPLKALLLLTVEEKVYKQTAVLHLPDFCFCESDVINMEKLVL